MSKKQENKRNPFKGFSKEEQIFFEKLGRPVENYRMPAMPRPTIFEDKTKFKRSKWKQDTRNSIKEDLS